MARPPIKDRTALNEGRVAFAITPELRDRVKDFAEADPDAKGNVSFVFKRAIERDMEGSVSPHPSMVGVDSLRLNRLSRVPCGNFREALESAATYVLSPDVKASLEAQDGDVVVPADGASMEGARIFDGDEILMRPLPEGARPRRGEIALVQITRKNGECEGTIKRWMKSEPPLLHDGEGQPVTLPKDTVKVEAVAVARGMIARLF